MPLLGKQRSGKRKDPQALHSWLSKQAKLSLHHSQPSPIYTLHHHLSSKGLASSRVFPTAHASVSVDITLPINLSLWKRQETVAHHQKFFWCVPLCGVLTNAPRLQNLREINTCVLLAKYLSSRVLAHACFSGTFFHLGLLSAK